MALRLLVYLAEREDSGLASAPEVSQALQVSYNNVVRIINRLQNAGLVVTHAGRYGGMELALPTEKITMRAVVTAIDGPTKLLPCSHRSTNDSMVASFYGRNHNCEISNCGIREELLQLSKQIEALLEASTLTSIVARHLARREEMFAVQNEPGKKSNGASGKVPKPALSGMAGGMQIEPPKTMRRKRASD